MIDTAVTLSVFPGAEYHFEVLASEEEYGVFVRTVVSVGKHELTQHVNFGSVEEMRAVARAMLQACDVKESME